MRCLIASIGEVGLKKFEGWFCVLGRKVWCLLRCWIVIWGKGRSSWVLFVCLALTLLADPVFWYFFAFVGVAGSSSRASFLFLPSDFMTHFPELILKVTLA